MKHNPNTGLLKPTSEPHNAAAFQINQIPLDAVCLDYVSFVSPALIALALISPGTVSPIVTQLKSSDL